MEFIEAPLFTKMLPDYLGDDEYRELQLYLTVQPEAGELMPGTGGLRKLRWADQRRGKGKRGGLRVIYLPPGRRKRDLVFHALRQGRGSGSESQGEEASQGGGRERDSGA
jgi:hypothetical protein